jgi:ribosomal RNA-processing protein 17
MFAKPRPKKSILPPQYKKRKATHAVEEVNFDFDARQEYLTGFHKRKQQRIKNAQEEAAKRARQEKLEMRKQVRHNAIRINRSQDSYYANMCCLDTRRTKARG